MDFVDLIKQILPFLVTTLIGAVPVAAAAWKAINNATARGAKITTAIAVATKDNKLTGDEINDIIDSFKGDLEGAKNEIRSRSMQP